MQVEDTQEAGTNARDVVIRRLTRELARRPDFALGPILVDRLDDRDARLAQAIYAECTRRLLTLEFLLNSKLSRPIDQLEVKLHAALVVGACQLFFFDHLPDHAVVDETVNWAGRFVRPKAKGLVNAVLRKMIELRGETRSAAEGGASQLDGGGGSGGSVDLIPLSNGSWVELTERILPVNEAVRWGVQTSHFAGVVSTWISDFGAKQAQGLLLHNLIQPPTILTGDFGGADESKLARHTDGRFRVWQGGHGALAEFLAGHPQLWVQDPASHAICESTAALDLAGQLIVDACAGSGTKTAQLAGLHPNAKVVATDVDERRHTILVDRFTDDENVTVVEFPELGDYARQAGLLLLDVPCSNTGVLARRIEAKYRIDEDHLDSLVNLQRQILANTLNCRADGGFLLYGTCSLEAMENEEQVEWIERWHRMKRVSAGGIFPSGQPGGDPSTYHDGGYHALLV